jgi:putative salt-induced outer membrane protein YdiY
VYVGLKGGQVVAGSVSLAGDEVRIKSTEAGALSVSRANIEFIRSKDEQTAYETTIERYRNPRLVDLWTGFVELGISETSGNAITSSITATADATRVTHRDTIDVHFTSLYASSRTGGLPVVTANARRGGISYNLNVTPKLFAFGLTDLEYDEFQGLDLRFAPAGGLGYHLIKDDTKSFDLLGGASLDREFFSNNTNRTSGEALLGEEGFYKLTARASFREKLTFYPNLTNTGDYRMNFDTSAVTTIWRWLGWHFTVSDRLLSSPTAGHKKNDLLFTTGLRLSFGR